MSVSRRKQCIETALFLYSNDISKGLAHIEEIISVCLSDPKATPYLEPLLNAIDNGNYNLAADILYYYLADESAPDINTDVKPLRFLMYEWSAYMQSDLEQVFDRLGISYDRFSYVFYSRYQDKYLESILIPKLEHGDYDAVFSMNYWPVLSDICSIAGVPYIAWSYDCPLPFQIDPSARHETTNLFVFDQSLHLDAKKLGITTVDHIPLAVNCNRLESITLSDEDIHSYSTDISFVGNLYNSDLDFYKQFFTTDEASYIEAVIQKQLATYGMYFLDQIVTDDFSQTIFSRIEAAGNPIGMTFNRLKILLEKALACEVTSRERKTILKKLSGIHTVRLYSPNTVPDAPNLIHSGTIENGTDMIKAFKASKINLNISYKQIPSGIPLRVLDILGAGGFLLTNYQKELSMYLSPGKDFVYYDSIDDAIEKANYYLHHEDERDAIAKHGHGSVKAFSYETQLAKIVYRSLGS